MEQQRLYPAELHVHADRPAEDWHLTDDEHKAVNRYGSHNQTGVLPAVIFKHITWQAVPGTPYSPGRPGQKARDGQYLYICVKNNLWKRAPVEDTFNNVYP